MKTKYKVLTVLLFAVATWLLGAIIVDVTSAAPFTAVAWQYDFAANPPCSATVTVSCVTGFELHHFNSGGVDTLDTVVALPGSPAGLMSLTTPIPASFPIGYGAVLAYMVTTAKAFDGSALKSAQATFSISTLPAAPINPHGQ
jgi:hypothetical protein